MKKFLKIMLNVLFTIISICGGASVLFLGLVALVPELSSWVFTNNLGYLFYVCFGLALAALVLPRWVVTETIVLPQNSKTIEGGIGQ